MSESNTSVNFSEKRLNLIGDLTFSNASNLLAEGNILLEKSRVEPVIINLDKVTRIDSAGIALLLEWKRSCSIKNQKVFLEGVKEQAKSLIETYKLQTLFS